MSHLGRGVDELEDDWLEVLSAGSWVDGLSENEGSLLGSDTASLDHDEVVLDESVVHEASHGVDALLGEVELGGGVGGVSSLSDSVDLLVHLGSLMVTQLTASGDGPLDSGGVPRPDTSDFSESSVSLSGELSDSESLDDSGESVSLGGSDDVDDFEVLEDLVN